MTRRKLLASTQKPDRLGSIAKKTILDGRKFASKLEAAVYLILKAEEQAGLIANVKCQPNIRMTDAGILMIPDFSYERNGKLEFCEAKGFPTDVWKLKLRLWKNGYGPGPLRIFKGSHRRPVQTEIVVPKALKEGEL